MRVRIDVTEEDIKMGKRNSSQECPIAIALSRESGTRVTTLPFTSRYRKFDRVYRIRHPDEVVSFIFRFDQGEAVFPFSFDIEPEISF